MRKTPRGWIQIGESRTRGVARIPLGLKPSRDSRATSQRDSPIWIQPLGVFRYRSMMLYHYILYVHIFEYIDIIVDGVNECREPCQLLMIKSTGNDFAIHAILNSKNTKLCRVSSSLTPDHWNGIWCRCIHKVSGSGARFGSNSFVRDSNSMKN